MRPSNALRARRVASLPAAGPLIGRGGAAKRLQLFWEPPLCRYSQAAQLHSLCPGIAGCVREPRKSEHWVPWILGSVENLFFSAK